MLEIVGLTPTPASASRFLLKEELFCFLFVMQSTAEKWIVKEKFFF